MIPPRQRRSLPSLSCIGLITRAADCSELMQMKVACHLAGLFLCRSALAGDSAAIAEELGNSKVPWKGPYLVDSRRQPARPLGKRALHPRLDRVVSLILILLLSLGLWAAIWVVVGSLASAVVG
jgi:hypothetical protein